MNSILQQAADKKIKCLRCGCADLVIEEAGWAQPSNTRPLKAWAGCTKCGKMVFGHNRTDALKRFAWNLPKIDMYAT